MALPVCAAGFAALESIGFDGTPFVAVTTVYGVAWAILGYHLWTRRVEKGLVQKEQEDGRTNSYSLTRRGRHELKARREWEDNYLTSVLSSA